jgi:hypothetical protein
MEFDDRFNVDAFPDSLLKPIYFGVEYLSHLKFIVKPGYAALLLNIMSLSDMPR